MQHRLDALDARSAALAQPSGEAGWNPIAPPVILAVPPEAISQCLLRVQPFGESSAVAAGARA